MLQTLDNFLISLATQLSHWLQKLIGLTCYSIAKFGLFLAIVTIVLSLLNYLAPFLTSKTSLGRAFLGTIVLAFLALAFLASNVKRLDGANENIASDSITKIENISPFFRLLFLAFLISDLVHMIKEPTSAYLIINVLDRIGFSLGCLIYLYFIEVTPLPPGRSKVKKWLDGLFFNLKPAPTTINSD